MANSSENMRCFLGQIPCPTAPDPTSPDGSFVCRAWDGKKCTILTLVEAVADEFLKSRITTKYPESAPPPRVKT